ncbi:type II toxin-antitoxin system Phd/YefM family antitoxin [bacterium]|nr:type II toxin-antitoxin system Phd/YefM family antitoxin [bacterium]
MVQTTYTALRGNLAEFMDRAVEDSEIIIVHRNKVPAVAMLAATELESLLETLYLLRSPNNRRRLFSAFKRAEEGTVTPSSLDDLLKEVGLAE